MSNVVNDTYFSLCASCTMSSGLHALRDFSYDNEIYLSIYLRPAAAGGFSMSFMCTMFVDI